LVPSSVVPPARAAIGGLALFAAFAEEPQHAIERRDGGDPVADSPHDGAVPGLKAVEEPD